MALGGDARLVTIGGVDYRVITGADFDRKPPFQIESRSTSGEVDYLVTKQNPDVDAVDLSASGAERENLLDAANPRNGDVDLAYVTQNGDTYTGSGRINIVSDNTADAKMTVMMMPKDGWAPAVV